MIVIVFIAAAAALLPLLASGLWLPNPTGGLIYSLRASVILALAFALILLIFLPIHFTLRKKFVVSWWTYVGIGVVYVLAIQFAVSVFTSGSSNWDEYLWLVASGCCVGGSFWLLTNTDKKAVRLVFGIGAVLLCWPVFALWGSIALIPVKVWLGTEAISQTDLPDGAALQVIQIPNGSPVGPAYSYSLMYRDSHNDSFEMVYGWERPPGRSDFEIAQISNLLTVITPGRDVLLVHTESGRWKSFELRQIISERVSGLPGILALENHTPRVTVGELHANSNVLQVEIEYAGILPQSAFFQLDSAGDRIEIVNVEFPEDPRLSYYREIEFDASGNNVLTIVRDMDNDGLAEVLVSHTDSRNGRAGNIWNIYRQDQGNYRRIPGNLSIRTDVVSLWTPDGGDTTGLTTFHPGNSTEGVIAIYTLNGDEIVERTISVASDDRRVAIVTGSNTQLSIMVVAAEELSRILCSSDRNHRRCLR